MAEFNIGFSPKYGASVAFQKVFTSKSGAAINSDLHAIQIPAAGLRATRKVATNPNAANIVGNGYRATLKFVCAGGANVTVQVDHFDNTKSASALGGALVGHVRNADGLLSTACVEALVKTAQYV